MGKRKHGIRKRSFLVPCILLIVDIALLIVIIGAYISEKEEPSADTLSETLIAQENTSVPTATPAASENSSLARPTDTDFRDWYIQDAMWKGMPQGVERITDFDSITGTWKGMIYYDPQSLHGREAIEMLNFTVGGTESALTLTADLYSIYYVLDRKSYSETDTEDVVFTGVWEDCGISASGAATVHITDFYTLNEKQCAIGEMKCEDGLYAKVAMVRP